MSKVTCKECIWVEHFTKRPDEPSNYGCGKLGYEGYVNPEYPECKGQFFVRIPQQKEPHR